MSSVLTVPQDSEGMGAIFQQCDAVTITGGLDGVHVGHFTSHVRDETYLGVGVHDEFLFEVLNIHDVIVVRFDVDSLWRNSVDMLECSGKVMYNPLKRDKK